MLCWAVQGVLLVTETDFFILREGIIESLFLAMADNTVCPQSLSLSLRKIQTCDVCFTLECVYFTRELVLNVWQYVCMCACTICVSIDAYCV